MKCLRLKVKDYPWLGYGQSSLSSLFMEVMKYPSRASVDWDFSINLSEAKAASFLLAVSTQDAGNHT